MVDFVGQITSSARTTAQLEIDLGAGLRRLDWMLMLAVGALVGYGLWAIAGITRFDVPGDPRHDLIRQAIAAGLGGVAFLIAVLVPPTFVRRYWRALYAGTIGIMLFVFVAGPAIRGSKRWLVIGPFQFQPSEFGKVLFVLALAGFLVDRAHRIGSIRTVFTAVGLGLVPMGLVFMQPDFGTATVYAAALAAVLFVVGIRWLHIVGLVTLAAVVIVAVLWLLPAMGAPLLPSYQMHRVTGFLHPSSDPSGATYNITQSKTAIGAGGFPGRGVSGASQTRLDYLPEHATDFVFASFAEQRGFLGVSILLLLYLLVVWRGLRIITLADDLFSATVAGGIVFGFLFQVFVNVGMTMGVAPVTGIPLPFVTVGGSSMVTNLLAIGVLQSIHSRGRTAAWR